MENISNQITVSVKINSTIVIPIIVDVLYRSITLGELDPLTLAFMDGQTIKNLDSETMI